MNGLEYGDWRVDLVALRDLSEQEKQGFGFVLAWFDGWRAGKGLEAGRPAAVTFWREQVVVKPRKP